MILHINYLYLDMYLDKFDQSSISYVHNLSLLLW